MAQRHRVTVERLETDPDARRRQIQSLAGAIVAGVPAPGDSDPQASTDVAVPSGRAAWLREVAAHRVPVIDPDDHPPMTVRDVLDPHVREQRGVAARRAALRCPDTAAARTAAGDDASVGGLPDAFDPFTPPFSHHSVSVLLATNRPERVVDVIDRVAAQTHANVELVAALHTPVDDGFVAGLHDRAEISLQVIDASDAPTLGEVLDRAVERASGEIVTKMDDDDLYDHEHLFDLLDALAYSGATLVGKGSEFVYLAEIDTTIRRFPNGVETANRNLAGGTLMIRREDLLAVGGWQPVPRGVDQALIDDVVAHGGTFHRTHGLGFVLNRHGTDHTWDVPVDYFLQQAVAQWPGLALDAAGFTGGPDLDRMAHRESAGIR